MESHDPEWKQLEHLLNSEAKNQSSIGTFRVIPSQENDLLEVKCEKLRKLISPEMVSKLRRNPMLLSKFVSECLLSNSSRRHEA